MRTDKHVSIIIPTRNRANWLKKSIEGVLNQTYRDFELIIVDDGSTDKTAEVVKSFKDKRIRYFRQPKPKGAAAARNLGIKKARGKLIAFSDDDDFWQPKKLEKQIKVFEKADEKIGVVYSGLYRIVKGKKKYIPESWVKKKQGNLHRELFLENFIDLSATMVRRECFDQVGLFDESLPRYQDWELWLRISQNYQFRFIDHPLVNSHVLPGGITQKKRVLLQASKHIFNKYQSEIRQNKKILAAWQFRLGDLYYHRQKMKLAKNFFRQAFKNQPSFKYFRAIMKTLLGKRISETLIKGKIKLVKNWQLLTVLFLALLLRLIKLNQSLWLDEAVQAITSQGSLAGIFTELYGDFHPPLYHLLMWFWVHLFGASEVILRLPSVIFGVATVYLIYKFVVHLHCRFVSLIVVLFMATAPFHIYYSQEARNYAMATFLASFSMYYFLRMLTSEGFIHSQSEPQAQHHSGGVKPSTSEVVLYLLSTTLLLYTNYFGLFILLAQALISLIQKRGRQLLLIGFCLLLFVPNLTLLRAQLLTGRQATTSLPEWGRLVNLNFIKALPLTFIKFSIGRITIFNKKIYAVVAGVLFVIYGGIISKGFFKGKKLLITNYQLLITFWLLIPILSAWLISFFIPNYQPFRLLLVLPAFYLLLAIGINQITSPKVQSMGLMIVLGVNLAASFVYYINPYFHREDWRGLVQFIESQPKEETVAILPSYTSHWPWRYYSSGKVGIISVSSGIRTITQEDLNNLARKQLSNKKIYYIRYLVPMFDPQEKIVLWLNQKGFVKIKEISFNQIPVWEYQRCQ